MPTVPVPKQIKSEKQLNIAIKYILNPKKTQEQILTSGHLIQNLEFGDREMNWTRQLARKMNGQRKKEVFAHHLTQNFDPTDSLSPEEIHEIGRQFALQLTKGEHEFVIATHVDQKHVHNHIIFNATSSSSLNNFEWKKDTLPLARELSDKISMEHGAKTLAAPDRNKNSYYAYQKYLSENPQRPEIKSRLQFLLRHSINLEEFLEKAEALNLKVDFSGKYATYRLLDMEQKKAARDTSLIRKKDRENPEKRIYSLEGIRSRLEKNKTDRIVVFSKEEIALEYNTFKNKQKEKPELTFILEPWQVIQESSTGIYVQLQKGRRQGRVRINQLQYEKLENGNYEVHVRKFDRFSFLDDQSFDSSSILYGTTLASQLARDNGEVPVKRNWAMNNVEMMAETLGLLYKYNIQGQESFKHLGDVFLKQMEETEQALQKLDEKIIKQTQLTKLPNSSYLEFSQLEALQSERKTLQENYKEIVKELSLYDNVKSLNDELQAQRQESQEKKEEQEQRTRGL